MERKVNSESIWNAYAGETDFPPLKADVKTETLIIGGGITGITLGMELSNAHQNSIIIEEQKIGGGTSSHSTGNLYVCVDNMLSSLSDKYDNETAQQVIASRLAALNQIKKFIKTYSLDCDFQTCSWYLYSTNREDARIQKELKAAHDLGLNMRNSDPHETPYSLKGIKLPDQAQFNPMKYVQELTKAINADYCKVYENTAAVKIEKKGEVYEVTTSNGIITAKNVVHATHTPKGIFFLQTFLGPYREYGIAFKTKTRIDYKGIFWGYHEDDKFSTRTYDINGEQFVLLIGQPHKVGQSDDNSQYIKNLEHLAHQHFDVDQIVFRWGGQHYRPADLLPYIGHKKNNIFVATGYYTDGLIYGTLAGMMIKDQLLGMSNPWSDLFKPSRFDPLKSAKNFLKENINVAKQYIDVLPWTIKDLEFENINMGKGKVVERKGHKLGYFGRTMPVFTVKPCHFKRSCNYIKN